MTQDLDLDLKMRDIGHLGPSGLQELCHHLHDDLTALRAENERLTKALRYISSGDAFYAIYPARTDQTPDYITQLEDGFLIASEAACQALYPHSTAHYSDCATNNAPALPVGPCDCGGCTPKPAGGQ